MEILKMSSFVFERVTSIYFTGVLSDFLYLISRFVFIHRFVSLNIIS